MARRFQVPTIASSDITPESVYMRRRQFMKAAGLLAAPAAAGIGFSVNAAVNTGGKPLEFSPAGDASMGFATSEDQTPASDTSAYCNFYEFGTGKGDPASYAHEMTIEPWTVEISGEVAKPGKVYLEELLKRYPLEERIYRLRCVEAWSMVIPWVGFPLASLLAAVEPTSKAKYVAFETLYRPGEMRGTRSFGSTIDWPYREGLRLDEAMHPLTLMAVGMYGKTLPNQNGAPIRLVVPWKYGFKSIKSVVRIHVSEKQPATSWQSLNAREYGFYSNVNPGVDHPRWSQKYERRLPSSLLKPNRIPTRMFNGYEEQVSELYAGMDLKKHY